MTLVKAFESNFVFYYHANPSVEMIYFLIFLLDEKEQVNPESFLYEFMIKSPKENHWKTKYVEKCFVLNDDITHLRDNELCAAITYRSIQKYLYEGHIHFSFLIKKTSKDLNVAIKASEGSKKETGKKKPKPYKADNKGCLKGNNVRKAPSIPDVKPSAADIIKKDIVVEVDSSKNQPPDYSSINRHNNGKQFASPVHATEAMKRNDVELLLLQQGGTRTDECYHFPNIMCQSYKSPDHKLYRQKYPSCCLSKPILKK
ncbi:CLUMA_CG015846, isoform A [Clunio marinus]|uniref:CLUMA_CG015846, isoform A n=1 Tax=Clunio marinus TaxID=568069 RepID=A0A1J1IRF6_9DIPT|nr:CLUMA_CG015846, isoform A [Clunio marinus]